MTLILTSLFNNPFAPVLLENYHKGMVYLLQRSALYAKLLQLGKRPVVMFRRAPPRGESRKGVGGGGESRSTEDGPSGESWSKLLIRLAELIHYKVGSGLSETFKGQLCKKLPPSAGPRLSGY
jgi:hypothetical protein